MKESLVGLSSTYKREIVRFSGTRLDQELVSPGIQRLEGFGIIDVVDKHTAISAAIEGNTK